MHAFRLAASSGLTALVFALGAVACSTTVTSTPDTSAGDAGKTSSSKDETKPGAGGGGGGSSSSGTGICADFCEKAASADCSSQSTCEADCQKQLDAAPACKDAAEALIACGGKTGTFDGCSSSGKPKLKGCDDETLAYLQCVQGGGPKDGGTNPGPSKCDQLETGDAPCDTCMDSKCCAQETACIDEPDCLDFFDCIGNGTPQATCESQHAAGAAVATSIDQCMQSSCAAACQ